jgi:hypothetical protein
MYFLLLNKNFPLVVIPNFQNLAPPMSGIKCGSHGATKSKATCEEAGVTSAKSGNKARSSRPFER